MKRALPALAALLLTSCASSWPANMPPTTYSGTIENKPQQKPEPNARIVAVRPGVEPGPFDHMWLIPYEERDVSIGQTVSGKDGRFVLTTTGGYATQLLVETQDHRMTAIADHGLSRNASSLRIGVEPAGRWTTYHVAVDQADVTAFGNICDKLMFNYAATDYTRTLSLNGYRARGIITEKDYALLLKLKPDILGPNPGMNRDWATMTLRIYSFTKPVEFLETGSHFTTEDLLRLNSVTFPPGSPRPAPPPSSTSE